MTEGKGGDTPHDGNGNKTVQPKGIQVRKTPRHLKAPLSRRGRRWARQLSVGDTLGETFRLYFKNFIPFTLIILILLSPILFLGFTVLSDKFDELLTLFQYLLLPVATGAIIYGVFRQKRGERVDLARCLAVGLGRLLPLIGVALIIALLQFIFVFLPILAMGAFSDDLHPIFLMVSIFLLIPACMIFCMTYVAASAVVVERLGPIMAIKRSFKLTRGNRWTVFAIVIVLGILSGLILFVISAILGAVSQADDTLNMERAVQILSTLIFSALGAIAQAHVFYTLKVRVEGVDEKELASVFD